MIERIKQWDVELFLALNGRHTPFWDTVMYWVTDRNFWFPFYALLIGLLIYRYRRQALGMLVTIILSVVVADKIASGLFKPFFARYRPCHDELIKALVHVSEHGCGGEYGFVSSHAANTFAMATAFWLLIGKEYPAVAWLFGWAVLVSYSRIYTGVHFPLDLLIGGLLGVLVAWLSVLVYHVLNRLFTKNNQVLTK